MRTLNVQFSDLPLIYCTNTVHNNHRFFTENKSGNIQQRCLRKIFNIKWYDDVGNATLLERANYKHIEKLISMAQTSWGGHVVK